MFAFLTIINYFGLVTSNLHLLIVLLIPGSDKILSITKPTVFKYSFMLGLKILNSSEPGKPNLIDRSN